MHYNYLIVILHVHFARVAKGVGEYLDKINYNYFIVILHVHFARVAKGVEEYLDN